MTTVLIDTGIAIDFLRGLTHAKNLLIPLWENGAAYLSVLSVHELHAVMRDSEKKETRNFIRAFMLESVTPEIAEKGGEIFHTYRKKGQPITAIGCLVGATALLKDHKIATRNIIHFPHKDLLLSLNTEK